MKSLVFLLAVSAASAASILPRLAENLPASSFPTFPLLSQAQFEAGEDLPPGGFNTTVSPTTHATVEPAAAVAATAAEASCSANPNIRIEWRSYPTADRLAFIAAIKCMMGKPPSGNFPPATSRYEDFARLHQLYMPNVHGNPKFLIWHRYYLWTFQMALRDECGFTAPLPWWDETLDAGNFHSSDLFTNTDYFGHLPGPDANGNPVCIVSGAFAGLTCHIGPGSGNTPHCLSRAVDESLTAQCNSGFVNTCNSRGDYASMESCLEGG
jgi:tyrosinase